MVEKDRNRDTKPDLNRNEGEGSTSAAGKYDRELEEFKETSDVEKLAEEAARQLDDDESVSTGEDDEIDELEGEGEKGREAA